jgi:hypothetical protein
LRTFLGFAAVATDLLVSLAFAGFALAVLAFAGFPDDLA